MKCVVKSSNDNVYRIINWKLFYEEFFLCFTISENSTKYYPFSNFKDNDDKHTKPQRHEEDNDKKIDEM